MSTGDNFVCVFVSEEEEYKAAKDEMDKFLLSPINPIGVVIYQIVTHIFFRPCPHNH